MLVATASKDPYKGKDPKYYRLICARDFGEFRKSQDKRLKFLEEMLERLKNLDPNISSINEQKINVEQLIENIKNGKEIHFLSFFRAFPSCMPSRNRDL